jgi:hypothetical protein
MLGRAGCEEGREKESWHHALRGDRAFEERSRDPRAELGEGFRLRPIERELGSRCWGFGYTIGHDCTDQHEGSLLVDGRCSGCDREVLELVLRRAPIAAAELALKYLMPVLAAALI